MQGGFVHHPFDSPSRTGLSTIAGNPIVDANFKKLMETVSAEDKALINQALARGLSKKQILEHDAGGENTGHNSAHKPGERTSHNL